MKQTFAHKNQDSILQDFAADRESILRTLAYFDIFNYPLTKAEIDQFLVGRIASGRLDHLLHQMEEERVIFLLHDFYSLQNNFLLVHRRRQGNMRAEILLNKAARIGRFLYQFPFVRSVAISGSLSKNFADEKADIDFFIITKANRLWLARTLMHLYKKFTFLAGRQHYYCMNYYIDEDALQLKEQNIYTAIELKTVLPICGSAASRQLFQSNEWAHNWFPQCEFRLQIQPDPTASWLKRFGELLFNNRLGNWLDNKFQKITTRRWKVKESKCKSNSHGLVLGLVTDKHYAYSNSGSFREKVVNLYEKKLRELEIVDNS
jgi:hypothetical protein